MKKPLNDFIAKLAKSIKTGLFIKDAIANPIPTMTSVFLDRASKLDNYKKIRGAYRNRIQMLNPRTKRWVIIDTKTNKIVRVKKTFGPAKNIRKLTKTNMRRKSSTRRLNKRHRRK